LQKTPKGKIQEDTTGPAVTRHTTHKVVNMRTIVLSIVVILFSGCANQSGFTCSQNLHCENLTSDAWAKNDNGYDRARAFANRNAIYAVYSANVYDKPASAYPPIFLPSNEYHRDILHNKGIVIETNFRAKAWLRYRYGASQPQKPILVIAFRGTDSWLDTLSGNLRLFETQGLDQFKSAKTYTHDVLQYLRGNRLDYAKIVFTGHSLGGGLAEYMQLITDNSEAVVFMPSPNNGFLYSLTSGDKRKSMNTTRIYEKGEILNILRLAVSHDYEYDAWPNSDDDIKTAWINFFKWSPIENHGIRDFAMKMLQIADIEGNCSARNVLEQINTTYGLKINLNENDNHRLACAAGNNEVENQKYPIEL